MKILLFLVCILAAGTVYAEIPFDDNKDAKDVIVIKATSVSEFSGKEKAGEDGEISTYAIFGKITKRIKGDREFGSPAQEGRDFDIYTRIYVLTKVPTKPNPYLGYWGYRVKGKTFTPFIPKEGQTLRLHLNGVYKAGYGVGYYDIESVSYPYGAEVEKHE